MGIRRASLHVNGRAYSRRPLVHPPAYACVFCLSVCVSLGDDVTEGAVVMVAIVLVEIEKTGQAMTPTKMWVAVGSKTKVRVAECKALPA